MACNSDVVTEEIEALQAIMMDEISVQYDDKGQPCVIEIIVKPATAQNIEAQHVRVTLLVNVSANYPDESPKITLRNPRGINDDVLQLIEIESMKKCEEFLGCPVIYELIELVREKLTANNTPSCSCAICLFNFTQHDHFTKTPCFHYFHSNCLGRYVLNCEETAAAEEQENQQPLWITREKKLLLCPICREPLSDEQISGDYLLKCPPPYESSLLEDFCPNTPEIVALQEKMASLLIYQKSKGGVIDLEEEKNKFLVAGSSGELGENGDLRHYQRPQTSGKKSKETVKKYQNNYVANKGGGHANQVKRNYSASQHWWTGKNKNSQRGNKTRSQRGSHYQAHNPIGLISQSENAMGGCRTKDDSPTNPNFDATKREPAHPRNKMDMERERKCLYLPKGSAHRPPGFEEIAKSPPGFGELAKSIDSNSAS